VCVFNFVWVIFLYFFLNIVLEQARLSGLEKAAGILAPMRTSVTRVSTQLSDIWGPYAGAHVASPLDYAKKTTNPNEKWGKEQPRLLSYLRNSPDPQFSYIAEKERAKRSSAAAAGGSAATKEGGWNSVRNAVARSLGGGPELVRAKLAVLVAPLDDDMSKKKGKGGTVVTSPHETDVGALTLAARVAQLEKLANRHDYKCVIHIHNHCAHTHTHIYIHTGCFTFFHHVYFH
jgi:hypothetical protein